MYIGNLGYCLDKLHWGIGVVVYLPDKDYLDDTLLINLDFFCFHICYTYVYEQKRPS